MKRKIIAVTVLIMFLLNISVVGVFADNNSNADEQEVATNGETVTETIYGEDGQPIAEVEILTVNPGTTPDKTFYEIKRLFENVQLFLTFSSEDKAALLADFAEKRLAEAQAMDEDGKMELVKEMVDDYAQTLLDAQEKAEETVANGLALKEVLEKMEDLLGDNIGIINKIIAEMPELEENLDQLRESLEIVKMASDMLEQLEEDVEEDIDEEDVDDGENADEVEVDEEESIEEEDVDEEDNQDVDEEQEENENEKQENVDLDVFDGLSEREVVQELRNMGYGFGEIGMVFAFAKKADLSIKDVIELREAGLGWGNVAKKLKVNKKAIAKEIGKMVIKSKHELLVNTEEVIDEADQAADEENDEENEEAVNNEDDEDEDEDSDEDKDDEKDSDDEEDEDFIIEMLKKEMEVKKELMKKELEIKKEILKKEQEIKREMVKKEREIRKEQQKAEEAKGKGNGKKDK